MELFAELNAWHWGIIAVVLIIFEIFAPGAFLLWLGIAAAVISILMIFMPNLGWEAQFVIFAIVSVLSIVIFRQWRNKNPEVSDQPALNRRGAQYVGRVFTLEVPIVDGQGKLHVDDSSWKIVGEDCDAGTKVRVTGVDGVVLRIERV
ncbi:NfeD family protein [Sulfuriflexus sp.]|uniref:NfeD family protein n=1 Tax=Sulfuriflexus sp. TaxID=2015443 RepID=UPI0028CD3FB5|nr:NfeD family protein [Sulfuriflexus sp.]MDT8403656.1 NfeD family protein [Sulfuriflexus sp.]